MGSGSKLKLLVNKLYKLIVEPKKSSRRKSKQRQPPRNVSGNSDNPDIILLLALLVSDLTKHYWKHALLLMIVKEFFSFLRT